jgi:hypothetical protein
MSRKFSSNSSGNVFMIPLVLIVVVVLGLGIYAVSGKISGNVRQNRIDGGNSRVEDIADQSGMEIDDFLAQYGLTSEDGITGKSTPTEMAQKLTLENYSSFMWGRELTDDEFNEFKTSQEIGDDVTKDTVDSEVKSKYDAYAYEKNAEEEAAQATASAEQDGTAGVDVTEGVADETDGASENTEAETAEEAE